MAETLLANGASQRGAGERYQVVVHAEPAALSEDPPAGRSDDAPAGGCEFDDGPAVPAETARRLACDASLVTIIERDGRPLSVGRKTRAVPASMRRALGRREKGCRFPGCDQRRFVDAHHVHHWAQSGETELSNLLLLCRHHHRLVHEGGYSVECSSRGGATFRRPDGRAIPPVPRSRGGDPQEVGRRQRRAGAKPRPEGCAARSAGDHFDYGVAVEALLNREGLLMARGSAEPRATALE